MPWYFWILIPLASFITGIPVGMWIERFIIYDRLLKSTNPESWTAAHKVRVPGKKVSDEDEDSDVYPPTPTHLRALRPRTPTEASQRDTVKMPALKDPVKPKEDNSTPFD